MDWSATLEFARGPLFQVGLLVFAGGMAYRLVSVLLLGLGHGQAQARGGRAKGVGLSFLEGLIILPFIPWLKNTFRRSPVMYLAGGLFHLGLFVAIFFSATHVMVWKSLLFFGWPALPQPIVDVLAGLGVLSMVALLVNRLTDPVLKLLTGVADWLNWLIVFLVMLTGVVMSHRSPSHAEMLFSLHMLMVDLLLIWIPFSRISHFIFYFFSRAIHGMEFAQDGA